MNNVEVKEDFIKTLKESFPHMALNERDELIIGMAINHTFLCFLKEERDEPIENGS